jgi:hypothetical protein
MKNNHWPLIIGICLPVIFILIISIALFVPSRFIKPEHNFIYSVRADNYVHGAYQTTFAVKDGKIVKE